MSQLNNRACIRCSVSLTVENISEHRLRQRQYICNTCWKDYQKNWMKKKRDNNPDYAMKVQIKHIEKVGREEYNRQQRMWYENTKSERRIYRRRYDKNHRKQRSASQLKMSKKMWQKIMDIVGDKCVACGKQKSIPQYLSGQKRRISFHEIHGRKHKENPYYVIKHLEDFVPLCQSCHCSLHKVAKYKKLTELLDMIVLSKGL